MERDLVPLVDIQKKSVFQSSSEEELFRKALEIIGDSVETGF